MPIEPGAEATVDHAVTEADTATALGSGDVDALGTPKVVALCEQAAVHAISAALEAGQTTVGVRIALEHIAPTTPGKKIHAHARLESVDGKTLRFAITAADAAGIIARGTHDRVIVHRDRFLQGARDRP